jgi:pyruvate/2-oxoglutarate dehydrogenase complex dihydrolipoamide dehydrogenase (E3) component
MQLCSYLNCWTSVTTSATLKLQEKFTFSVVEVLSLKRITTMSSSHSPEHYDYIALGCGEAGKYIAWMLSANHGKKCAVIERKWIGDSCPNVSCLPSKNFIYSASIAHEMGQAQSYGIGAYVANADSLKVQMSAVKTKKAKMVDVLIDTHLGQFKGKKVDLIRGEGKLIGPKMIQIDNGQTLTADALAICTGSTAKIDSSIHGLLESKPLTHVEILDLDELPSHLVILGDGYVGMELAQVFRRFGSEVTVIEKNTTGC